MPSCTADLSVMPKISADRLNSDHKAVSNVKLVLVVFSGIFAIVSAA
jgi:hypothetical protein